MNEIVLRIDDLTVTFDAGVAVAGLSLTVRAGECVALVGESGSGKSVTARSALGLIGSTARVTAGRLDVAGVDILTAGRRELGRLRGGLVGTISQDALVALDPLRLVGREVDDALRLHTTLGPVERRARVLELLAEAGIPDPEVRAAQRSDELSGGLRQRALIAAAIAASPRLVIADEPTTALDRQVRDGVLHLIGRQVDDGVGVLLISHDLDVVRHLANRVAVMKEGRIVEQGATDAVLHAPSHPYTRRLLDASPVGKGRFVPLSPIEPPLVAAPVAGATDPTVSVAEPTDTVGSRAGRIPSPTTPAGREPTARSALEAHDLSLAFDGPGGSRRTVLDSLSFTLPLGTTLGLVGPSGSGKTTIARVALGLQRPDAGELRLFGEPWTALPERERRPLRGGIGAVYQDPLGSFDPRLTVGRILDDAVSGARARRVARGAGHVAEPRAARVAELLEAVGLEAATVTRRPRSLSGGQRQRVAIARALAGEPRVLVLDEPVSSLDVSIQAQILDLLDLLQRERQLSYLFISHDEDVIAHMSDEVLTLGEAARIN